MLQQFAQNIAGALGFGSNVGNASGDWQSTLNDANQFNVNLPFQARYNETVTDWSKRFDELSKLTNDPKNADFTRMRAAAGAAKIYGNMLTDFYNDAGAVSDAYMQGANSALQFQTKQMNNSVALGINQLKAAKASAELSYGLTRQAGLTQGAINVVTNPDRFEGYARGNVASYL